MHWLETRPAGQMAVARTRRSALFIVPVGGLSRARVRVGVGKKGTLQVSAASFWRAMRIGDCRLMWERLDGDLRATWLDET